MSEFEKIVERYSQPAIEIGEHSFSFTISCEFDVEVEASAPTQEEAEAIAKEAMELFTSYFSASITGDREMEKFECIDDLPDGSDNYIGYRLICSNEDNGANWS